MVFLKHRFKRNPRELWKFSLPTLTPRNSDVSQVLLRNLIFNSLLGSVENKAMRDTNHKVSL